MISSIAIVDKELAKIAQERKPNDIHANIVFTGIRDGLKHLAERSDGVLEYYERPTSLFKGVIEMGVRSLRQAGCPNVARLEFKEDGSVVGENLMPVFRYLAPPQASGIARLLDKLQSKHKLQSKPAFDPDIEITKGLTFITGQAKSIIFVASLNRPAREVDNLVTYGQN